MSNVVILHKCGRCGKAHGKPFDLVFRGEVPGKGFGCDECIEKTLNELDRVRPVYEQMIRLGIPAYIASETMTHLLEAM